jgi:acyl-CoA synthetase (NDP forming)
MDLETSKQKVAALTAPRNAVLVGASDRPEAGRRARTTRYEFPGPIYLVNPRRTELWDRPCYPTSSRSRAADHLVVLVPARTCLSCCAVARLPARAAPTRSPPAS